MNAANERPQSYRFGAFEVDVLAHELRLRGNRIRLQEQPFQVLCLLVEHTGKVVTREEFRQQLWPSSVFVDFDHGLNNAIARLREALEDGSDAPKFIETVPRVGYRFVGKVHTASESQAANRADTPAVRSPQATRRRWLIAGAGAAGLVLLATLLLTQATNEVRTNETSIGVSIAVLPFDNVSSNEEDESFADGLTVEVVSRLGGIRGVRVVARDSSFRFKDSPAPASEKARALQVSHLLEGSVRRSGDRLRITAGLIDAQQNEQVWAQTFDRQAGDIFQIQEEIAVAVVTALKVSLPASDQLHIRKRGTTDPEAYRLYMIANAHLLSRPEKRDLELAKDCLDAALERDPNFAAAHAGVARYWFIMAWSALTDTEQGAQLGAAAADRAVALDPELSEALLARAGFLYWRHRFQGDYQAYLAAERDMRRAVELDPTNSLSYYEFGRGAFWHEPKTALYMLEQSTQVDVLSTGANVMIASLLGYQGNLDVAKERCENLLKRFPDSAPCRMSIATLQTYFGQLESAVKELRQIEKPIGGAARIQLWSIYMTFGDQTAATTMLEFGRNRFEKPLSDAARFAMAGSYEQAFRILDRHRADYPHSRMLDLPAAKFALLAGKPQLAREILEQRVPDLAKGFEPVSARNVMPAIDLATARLNSGAANQAKELLAKVAGYLDDDSALRLPMFSVLRARVFALQDNRDAMFAELNRAYADGFRITWALDLRPQSHLYIDPLEADPAFGAVKSDPRFTEWLGRVKADSRRQLEHVLAQTPALAR